MSLDRSLKTAGALTPHRNVLTRPERVAKLSERGKFDPQTGIPLGLPKVANRKAVAAKAPKKEAAVAGAEGAAAPAAAAAAPAAGAKGAAGAKAAAPAAGAKGAAAKGADKKK